MLRYTRVLQPVRSALVRSALSRAPTAYQRRSLSVSRSLFDEQLGDKTDARNIAPQEDQGHPKISAVPFHFGREDADSRLKIAALLATGMSILSWLNLYSNSFPATYLCSTSNNPQPDIRYHPPLSPPTPGVCAEFPPRIRYRRKQPETRRDASGTLADLEV